MQSDFIYRLYTYFVIVWVILLTLIFGMAAIILSFFSKTGHLPHVAARMWGRLILWGSGIKVSVKGAANIVPNRSAIYMCNHQSNFDIPVLLAFLPVQFRWLAKAELFRIPIFGRGMRGCGYISIDRSNRPSAFESLALAARKIQSGVSVLIFPEGTRSSDGCIRPFKKGGFVMALNAKAPVLPVIINGTWDIMSKSKLLIKPGRVQLEIMEPIETKTYSRDRLEELMHKVRTVIESSYNRGKRLSKQC